MKNVFQIKNYFRKQRNTLEKYSIRNHKEINENMNSSRGNGRAQSKEIEEATLRQRKEIQSELIKIKNQKCRVTINVLERQKPYWRSEK